jgi:hypothetical protein
MGNPMSKTHFNNKDVLNNSWRKILAGLGEFCTIHELDYGPFSKQVFQMFEYGFYELFDAFPGMGAVRLSFEMTKRPNRHQEATKVFLKELKSKLKENTLRITNDFSGRIGLRSVYGTYLRAYHIIQSQKMI